MTIIIKNTNLHTRLAPGEDKHDDIRIVIKIIRYFRLKYTTRSYGRARMTYLYISCSPVISRNVCIQIIMNFIKTEPCLKI